MANPSSLLSLHTKSLLIVYERTLSLRRSSTVTETDHKNLTYWKSPRKLTGRTVWWHEKLQDYNFKILHITGKNNTPMDVLSRPSDDEQEVGE